MFRASVDQRLDILETAAREVVDDAHGSASFDQTVDEV